MRLAAMRAVSFGSAIPVLLRHAEDGSMTAPELRHERLQSAKADGAE
jgi:hypothetical protein